MAYTADYTVDVKAPQAKVFDYVADISRHGEWGSADDHMKATAEKSGPPAMGSRYKAEGMLNGKLNNSTVTITALESPRRLAFDAQDANSVFHHEFVLSAANGGTPHHRHPPSHTPPSHLSLPP